MAIKLCFNVRICMTKEESVNILSRSSCLQMFYVLQNSNNLLLLLLSDILLANRTTNAKTNFEKKTLLIISNA